MQYQLPFEAVAAMAAIAAMAAVAAVAAQAAAVAAVAMAGVEAAPAYLLEASFQCGIFLYVLPVLTHLPYKNHPVLPCTAMYCHVLYCTAHIHIV
jgi:hypothetical protein